MPPSIHIGRDSGQEIRDPECFINFILGYSQIFAPAIWALIAC